MALQTGSLAEMCSPLEVEDERELAGILEKLRKYNPRIHDDFELAARETRAFMRARGVRYRGTVEKLAYCGCAGHECDGHGCDGHVLVFFTLEMEGLDEDESEDLADELAARLAEKSPTRARGIVIDTA